jgi:hypothetical protein
MPPDASGWSETPIAVGTAPVEGVTITLRPGSTISGRIVFEGSAALPPPVQLQGTLSVAFEPPWFLTFGARMATRVTAAFEFITQGLPPGRYFANLPNNFNVRGWHFESAVHDGKDLLRAPLVLDGRPIAGVEITYADRRAELSGTILDANGRVSADSAVVVFPADYHAWIKDGLSPLATHAEAATQRGTYTVSLRPGDYLVAVVSEDLLATWPDPAVVNAIAATATKVTIGRGETRRLDLRRR